MKKGWHCINGYWFYGTSTSNIMEPEEPVPSSVVLYTEGPSKYLNEYLRTGLSKGYDPDKNWGMSLEAWADSLDQDLTTDESVPELVIRTDSGELASYVDSNGVVVDNGFLSTSVLSEENIPKGRFFQYVITGLTSGCGRNISEFSRFSKENEFLFRRGSSFKVLGIEDVDVGDRIGKRFYLQYIGFSSAHTAPRSIAKLEKEFTQCPWCGKWYPMGTTCCE